MKLHHQKQVMQQLDEVSFAIIYGSLLIALIQGGIGAIGFYFFGISSPLTWGIIMSIFALIPFIGTAIVWLPMSLILVVQGITTSSSSTMLKGVGLLLYGALIISTIDNILKPHIIGKRAKIHPVLVLLGVLGGLAFFGFIGFIVGPLILAVVATVIEIYEKERKCRA
jgi:predicted PurR-regulated permease PerM